MNRNFFLFQAGSIYYRGKEEIERNNQIFFLYFQAARNFSDPDGIYIRYMNTLCFFLYSSSKKEKEEEKKKLSGTTEHLFLLRRRKPFES